MEINTEKFAIKIRHTDIFLEHSTKDMSIIELLNILNNGPQYLELAGGIVNRADIQFIVPDK